MMLRSPTTLVPRPSRRWRRAALAVAGAVVVAVAAAPVGTASAAGGTADWLQFGGDAAHSGASSGETQLGAGNVAQLRAAFQTVLPGTADAPPVELSGVPTAGGVRDLLFVNTTNATTVAVDAHTGTQVWAQQVGPGSCHINNGGSACYTTSAPAIDPNRQFVYSYGLDGSVHKYATGTGVETTSGGWPQQATRKPFDEKGSADLTVATARNGTPYLYVASGGYPGDNGDYQGHITTINLTTGAQTVFNTLCSDQTVHFASRTTPDCPAVQSAVWSRAGVVYDPDTDHVYLPTGNGAYSPTAHDYGDSVLVLNPDGTGAGGGTPLDSYTPTNYTQLQNADADLGSTAPALVHAPPGSTVPHLGVQSGKDAQLRLLNLDNLSGQHAPNHTGGELQTIGVPQGGEVLTQPSTWINPADGSSWVFLANDNGLSALKVQLNGTSPTLVTQWHTGTGGTTPVLANGVLYYETGGGLRALNPTTGTQLWTDGASTGVHWQSPIVVNGVLYDTDGHGHLNAYTLPTGARQPSTTTLSTSPNAAVGVTGVALFATINPATAGGTVAFTDNTTPIPGCTAIPVTTGAANCVTTFTTGGTHTLTATYAGDATHTGSTTHTALTVTTTPDFLQIVLGYLISFAHTFHLFGL